METSIAFYQRCIKTILRDYANLKTDDIEVELIFDDKHQRYLAVWIGWQAEQRIYQCAMHIDIQGDKIVIQLNDTEVLIEDRLVDMGVPRRAIELAMIPLEFRKLALSINNEQEAA